jgi:hypothetical protein
MPRLSLARACLAALVGLAALCLLGGRSFASDVASAIVNLRPPAILTNHTGGPIPFILDLKHKRASRNSKAPARRPAADARAKGGPKAGAPSAARSAPPTTSSK